MCVYASTAGGYAAVTMQCQHVATVYYYAERDNYKLKSHKSVCITTYQPHTKSNPNPIPNPNAIGY